MHPNKLQRCQLLTLLKTLLKGPACYPLIRPYPQMPAKSPSCPLNHSPQLLTYPQLWTSAFLSAGNVALSASWHEWHRELHLCKLLTMWITTVENSSAGGLDRELALNGRGTLQAPGRLAGSGTGACLPGVHGPGTGRQIPWGRGTTAGLSRPMMPIPAVCKGTSTRTGTATSSRSAGLSRAATVWRDFRRWLTAREWRLPTTRTPQPFRRPGTGFGAVLAEHRQ